MKLYSVFALVVIGFHASLLRGESPAAEDAARERAEHLATARNLLGEFRKAVDVDDERASEVYEEFTKMPEFIQLGFLKYLESEWETRKRAYKSHLFGSSSMGGGARSMGSRALTPNQKTEVRACRETLARIRGIGDENLMKKELKTGGFPALQDLLRLLGSRLSDARRGGGGGDAGGGTYSEGKGEAALRIGGYRCDLRKHLGKPLKATPEEELGMGGKAPKTSEKQDEEVEINASGADRKVLQKNIKLKAELKSDEAEGIRQLNEWRIAMGLKALEIDPKLCDAARDHSEDMAAQGFFSHSSPVKGKATPWARAKNFGTTARAENIAMNGSATGANQSWFFSPGHHKNMFGGHSFVGLGRCGKHFTQLFR